MFTQGWIVIGAILLGIGVVVHSGGPFLIGTVVLLGAGASFLSHRYALHRVQFTRTFTPRRAFYGEDVTLTIEVTNRKPLPLAWLEVTDELPESLIPQRGRVIPSLKQRRQHLVHLFSLKWYERVRRRSPSRARRAGIWRSGRAGALRRSVWITSVERAGRRRALGGLPKDVPLKRSGCRPGIRWRLPSAPPAARGPHAHDRDSRLPDDDPIRRVHWKARLASGVCNAAVRIHDRPSIRDHAQHGPLGEYAAYRGSCVPC